MGKIGLKFSHLFTVRAEGADPPSPLTVNLTVKRPFFFLTTSLSYIENKFRINCFKESIQQSTTSRLAASCCLSPEMDPMLGRLQLSELNSISITIITITVPFLCVLTIVILRAQQLDGGGWRLNGTKVTHWAKKSHFSKVTHGRHGSQTVGKLQEAPSLPQQIKASNIGWVLLHLKF